MDLEAGALVDGRYRIQGTLGEGGMAVVYQVQHEQLGTTHALKVLSLTQREVRERMLQEGRLQAKLRHPNIVAVTDVIVVDRSPALVMELVDGMPLDELVRMQKLSIEQVDVIGRGILAGVAHAHALGLVHRDLKPANILLEIVGQTVKPKIADFGLAKLLRDSGDEAPATRTGSTMGTPQYMSPEQIRDSKNVDARGDLFALAAIFYEMLTGRRAFEGDNVLDIFQAVDRGLYLPVRELRADAPDRMIAAIEAGLVGDREERITSAEALYELWTDGAPLDQAPPPATLGSLPSYADLQAQAATQPGDAKTSPSTLRRAAPMVMFGGSMMALVAAVAVIALLLIVVIALLARPPETVEIRGETVERTVVVPVPVPPVPSVERPDTPEPQDPAPESPEPDAPEAPEPGMGVPWDEMVDENGELREEATEDAEDAVVKATLEEDESHEDDPVTGEPPGDRRARAWLAGGRVKRRILGGAMLLKGATNARQLPSPDLMKQVLRKAEPGFRKDLLQVYGQNGTSLSVPAAAIDLGLQREGLEALVKIARRMGTEAEARSIVLERTDVLKDGLENRAMAELGGP